MKVDFSTVLTDFKGHPLADGKGPSLTLGVAAENALVGMTPQAQQESGEQKYRNWKLAQLASVGGVVDLTPEDAAVIKAKIGEFYSAAVVGPAYELLNG